MYFERLDHLLSSTREQSIAFTDISKRVILDYILSLKGRVSDETINGRIRAYRRFFNFLVAEGLWQKENPMAGIRLLKTASKVKSVVDPETVQKIVRSLSRSTFESSRDLVMVLLFWDGVLRDKEIRNLKLADIEFRNRLIRVFGKGRKERLVPLGVKTLKALHHHVIKFRSKYPGDRLICMRNGQPLTERCCRRIIQRIGEKHGVKLHPHLLRHSAATWYIRQGGNPAVLQGILGHTSLLVTQKHVRLSSQDAVASHEQFSPAKSSDRSTTDLSNLADNRERRASRHTRRLPSLLRPTWSAINLVCILAAKLWGQYERRAQRRGQALPARAILGL